MFPSTCSMQAAAGGFVTRRHFPGIWLTKRKHKKLGDAALGLAHWRCAETPYSIQDSCIGSRPALLQWIGLRGKFVKRH